MAPVTAANPCPLLRPLVFGSCPASIIAWTVHHLALVDFTHSLPNSSLSRISCSCSSCRPHVRRCPLKCRQSTSLEIFQAHPAVYKTTRTHLLPLASLFRPQSIFDIPSICLYLTPYLLFIAEVAIILFLDIQSRNEDCPPRTYPFWWDPRSRRSHGRSTVNGWCCTCDCDR